MVIITITQAKAGKTTQDVSNNGHVGPPITTATTFPKVNIPKKLEATNTPQEKNGTSHKNYPTITQVDTMKTCPEENISPQPVIMKSTQMEKETMVTRPNAMKTSTELSTSLQSNGYQGQTRTEVIKENRETILMTTKPTVTASSCKSIKIKPEEGYPLRIVTNWTTTIQPILQEYYTSTHINELSSTNRFRLALERKSLVLSHILSQSAEPNELIFSVTSVKNAQQMWVKIKLEVETLAISS